MWKQYPDRKTEAPWAAKSTYKYFSAPVIVPYINWLINSVEKSLYVIKSVDDIVDKYSFKNEICSLK